MCSVSSAQWPATSCTRQLPPTPTLRRFGNRVPLAPAVITASPEFSSCSTLTHLNAQRPSASPPWSNSVWSLGASWKLSPVNDLLCSSLQGGFMTTSTTSTAAQGVPCHRVGHSPALSTKAWTSAQGAVAAPNTCYSWTPLSSNSLLHQCLIIVNSYTLTHFLFAPRILAGSAYRCSVDPKITCGLQS